MMQPSKEKSLTQTSPSLNLISSHKHLKFHQFEDVFVTESGSEIHQPTVAYQTWGKLNHAKDNVVLICHALTGSADASEWFSGLFEQNLFDLDRQYVICSNVLGGCYGTTGPQSINPLTGEPYRAEFPVISIRDMVQLQRKLLDVLEITSIECVIGGSMGGMQALEWGILDERIQKLVLIGMGKAHSAWAIGLGEAQRRAIMADPRWKGGNYHPSEPPQDGLASARMVAMLSYRTYDSYHWKFGRDTQHVDSEEFSVTSYLNYQGKKLVERFDALSYVRLTQAMDLHDISRGRGSFKEVLAGITVPTLLIGIDSDILYPPTEQREIARMIPNARYREINSIHGHDAFLIDFDQLFDFMNQFLTTTNA